MSVVPASEAAIATAGAAIRTGALVAFPTETVYGLGADATNGEAVARIFAAKGRPRFNPLIVHVAAIEDARTLARLSPLAERLASSFWPGPLTMVMPRKVTSGLSDLVTAGLDTVAIRMPAHPVARQLIAAAGRPLAAPSANRSGHVSPTLASHVAADLGERCAMILDAGPTRHGLESTVIGVDSDDVVLLRPGAITADDIAAVAGCDVRRALDANGKPVSPGQLASHYAPKAAVRLNVMRPRPGAGLIAFAGDVPPHDGPVINLSPEGNLVEAAAGLFAALRNLDAAGVSEIDVMPIPDVGLGEAINDRLRRAAAPR